MQEAPAGFFLLNKSGSQQGIARLVAAVGRVEGVDRLGRNHARQVGADHLRNLPGPLDESFGINSFRRNDAAHRAVGAQMADQGAGVDLGQHGNRIALHVLVGDLFRAPIGADGRKLAHYQALDKGLGRLVVRLVGPVIADLGVGENYDLAGIGGIGRNLLIAGKGSIENDFAPAFARSAIAVATEDAPVFER